MDKRHSRNVCVIYLLMFICASAAALAAPATLTQSVTYNSETITMRLTKENLRGDHFELWVQNSSGTYDVITPVEERSYIGTVDEYPDAVACGILKDNGVFWGAVYFDRGVSWYTLGTSIIRTRAGEYDPSIFNSFNWTDWSIVGPGDAGTTMYGFDVGIDVCNDYYNHAGSTAAAFEQIEHSVSVVRPVYMSNALMRPYLGRVIIRGDQQQDPYYGTTNFALDVAQHWQANHTDADRDLWAGVSPTKIGGGLAWGCVVGTISAASGNQSYYGEGDFESVWRHEMGHNWCGSDYHADSHEGATIMCGNAAARFNGSMVDYMFGHRDSRIGIFDNLGTYSAVDIPPYAALDQVTVQTDLGAVMIDVIANDFDANGDSLSLLSFDPLSKGGASISRGTGGDSNNIIYTPSSYTGLDTFYYKVVDSSGSTASGAVVIRAWTPDLVYHWPLDGHLLDVVSGNYGLNYGTVLFAEGADGLSNAAISVTSSDFVWSAGYISIYGQPRTINCWFKIDTNQDQSLFSYGGRGSWLELCEINITSERKIYGHFWGPGNDTLTGTSRTFSLNQWVMATLVYDGTTVYMYQDGNLINSKAISLYTTDSAAYIGGGNGTPYEAFDGQIDDVRVYSYVLDPTEITTLYNEMSSGPRLVHHWPFDGDLLDVVGGNDGFNYGTVSFADGVDSTSNGAISVTDADFVWSADNLSIAGPAQRTISFWFKSTQQTQAAVSFGSRSSEGGLFETLLNYPTGSYAGHFWGTNMDTGASGTGNGPVVSWNTWTMVTMTYDGTDVKLYQNGLLKRTAALALDTWPTPMYIGGGNGSGGQWDYDQFSGQIDEVKIWDIALTPAEVLSEYNQFINHVATIDVGDGVAVDEESPVSDTYTIVMLESPPADATGGIKIVLDAADYTGQLTLVPDPNTIVFTTGNWNTPQTVTVTAIDDAVGEGPHSVTLYHELDWVDPDYEATDPNFISPKIENSIVTVDIIDEPWWDHFPRIVQDPGVSVATSHHANIIFNGAQSDPGWGTYFQTWNLGSSAEAHAAGLKNISYYETFGQSMNIIAEIGTWNEVDLTPIYHTAWDWENYGGGTIRWLGTKNFFDDEDFARPYTRTHPRYGGPPMRYPDGTEATGYDGDPTDPYNSRVYDAGCSKNVLGGISHEYNDTYIISFSKDSACPMWIDYAYASTLLGADAGMDGMWTDNFSAWDSFNAWPVWGAFGDWSVARFRDYLSDNFTSTELTAMGVTNVSTFDIRSELRSIASGWGWDGWDLNHSVWGLSGWLDEPLWRAYTIFKRQTGTEALTNYSNAVHAAALDAGVTDFLIAGNDIPVFSLGWVRGNLDMVSTELSASWHLESGPRGYMLPPIGRFSPTYKLAREHALSRFVNVWLYDNGYEAYLHNPGICKVLYYEMLASHAMPMFFPAKSIVVGNETVNTEFFDFVSQVESVYGQRIPVEDIGIYYSSSSILSRMTPGGYLNHSAQPHQFAFWGWATALGELHYQYRTVPEWKLDSATLADLRVLVIPESKVFIPNDVANVLEPWVQNGGLLIVTGVSGRNLGEAENFDVKSGGYSLAPLTGVTDIGTAPAEQLQSIGAGKVLYIRDNIGMGYYNADTTRPSLLPQFADAMTTVLNGSDPLVLTPGSGVTSRVGLSVFEDSSAGKLFVDVTNFDIDINTDTITDTSELTFSVQLPLWLQGIPLSVHVLSPESTLTADINTPTSDRVDITVQPLQYYASIVIGAIQVHYWPFNGDLLDVAGGNDGIANGTVSFVEGADGTSNGAIFVTDADFVWSADNLSIAGPAQRTISFWFRSAQQTQAAVSFGSRSLEGGLFEVLLNHPTGGFAGHFWGSNMDTGASGTGNGPVVSWNDWTMVTMTYDGTDVKLYQNDELKRTATLSLDTAPTHLYIGGHNDPAWYGGYAGLIDDVRVYNYVLDDSEVTALYNDMLDTTYSCDNPPTTDLTNDCVVDFADLAVFAQDWLTCGRFPVSSCP